MTHEQTFNHGVMIKKQVSGSHVLVVVGFTFTRKDSIDFRWKLRGDDGG